MQKFQRLAEQVNAGLLVFNVTLDISYLIYIIVLVITTLKQLNETNALLRLPA